MPRRASELEILTLELETYSAGPYDRRCRECGAVQPRHLPSCSGMGYTPPGPMPTSAQMFLAAYERRTERQLRGRFSRLPWRRRRAYEACLTLIKVREALLGWRPDPWEPKRPPPPVSAIKRG